MIPREIALGGEIPMTPEGLRWLSRLSDVLPLLRSRVRFMYRTCEEFVNALPKVVGFLRVLRFPPIGKVDRVVRINSLENNEENL